MNLYDFVQNIDDYREDIAKNKVVRAMFVIMNCLENMEPDVVVSLVKDGLFDIFVDMEADDVWGTEGLKI